MSNNCLERKLVLLGGGGHCRSIIDSARAMNSFSEIVIVDPGLEVDASILGCKVVGGDDNLQSLYDRGFGCAAVAVGSLGDSGLRHRLNDIITKIGFEMPIIADPSAIISSTCVISEGVFLAKQACVNSEAIIGRNVIINTSAIVDHNCNVGDYVHVAVGAVICGGCILEENVFVGANSTIIQEVQIGQNSIIGAGSLVLADVPKDTIVKGIWNG